MIFLSLGLLGEQLLPSSRRRMDRIDHLCLWTIKICLVILFLTLPHAVHSSEESEADQDFFFYCSGGKLEDVETSLKEHPSWINARTDNGETCLHLTGINGHSPVTELLLKQGADPNVRSTFEQGLRMHPLSWNVYGGHFDNIELLLRYGAHVNLDFDAMGQGQGPVTALDVVLQLIQNEEGDDRFVKLEELLRKHGGKTTEELRSTEQKEEL